MKKEFIAELFKKFEDACYDYDGVECWSARELQDILGYSQWRNFKNVIDKAQKSCEQAGEEAKNHFAEFSKMVEIGSGAQKPIEDIALTRYSCYLIAQNGDATTKSEIAFAQTYFAVQTRKQEIIEKRLLDIARVTARENYLNLKRNFRELFLKEALIIKVLHLFVQKATKHYLVVELQMI